VKAYLAEIGRRGGRKSRRVLDPETDPAYSVGPSDIVWVAEQLRKHGGRDAWEVARKLCR